MIATPTRSRVGSKSETSSPASIRWSWIRLAITARIPIAVGSSIATVAVLETKAEIRQVMTPKAMMTLVVLLPTPGSARMRNANLRASPCLSIDWARMKAPMKVKIVPEPNGASTVSASSPTPSRISSAAPTSPATGIGIGSVIHMMMTASRTAATVCCSAGRSSGRK